jgi:integrase
MRTQSKVLRQVLGEIYILSKYIEAIFGRRPRWKDYTPEWREPTREQRFFQVSGLKVRDHQPGFTHMLEPAREALVAQKALSWMLGDYVFVDSQQRPLHQELFRMKVWKPRLKRLGIRYRPPYQMRHTFATLAMSMGENINWVARMLGHKSLVVTLEKYNRFGPNLIWEDGQGLIEANKKANRSGPLK